MPWLNNKKIIGLYCYGPQNRNVQVFLDGGTGWRLLWPANDCQSEVMAIMASHARSDARPVKVFEESNRIKTMYVF